MLTESFIASTLTPAKPTNSTTLGIHVHEFQPLPGLKSTFKKSSSKPNCLAVSFSHIFTAQADKAVVNVYSKERGNQEAVVPFPERIHCIALAGERDGAGILALGTESGRVSLWELGTGRQISTHQHHLQSITCLAVDPSSNFLLSGSLDSSINLWSIPGLLSFSAPTSNSGQDLPFSPLRSLSSHRAAITAVVFGHSFNRNNIAVSASKDGTCVVWDFLNGASLHTYLLPSAPLCLVLDPADRAAYAGYDDGSIQLIDFYKQPSLTQPLHDPALQYTPTQPSSIDRWTSPGNSGAAALCLQVSYDGTRILSGHEDGKIYSWDAATGKYGSPLADFAAPITGLIMLAPTGFPTESKPNIKLQTVVKPGYESFTNSSGKSSEIPLNYTFTAQLTSNLPLSRDQTGTSFHKALVHPSFPQSFLEEALADFSEPLHSASTNGQHSAELADLRAQNVALASQLEAAAVLQRSTIAEIQERDKEEWRRRQDQDSKAARKKKRRLRRISIEDIQRKRAMGESLENGDEEMGNVQEEEENGLSSSTEEITESE